MAPPPQNGGLAIAVQLDLGEVDDVSLLAHQLGELGGICRSILAVPHLAGGIEGIADVSLAGGVEDGGHDLDAAGLGSVCLMRPTCPSPVPSFHKFMK